MLDIGYERCGELPLIVSNFKYLFDKPLKISTSAPESNFPNYLLRAHQTGSLVPQILMCAAATCVGASVMATGSPAITCT